MMSMLPTTDSMLDVIPATLSAVVSADDVLESKPSAMFSARVVCELGERRRVVQDNGNKVRSGEGYP